VPLQVTACVLWVLRRAPDMKPDAVVQTAAVPVAMAEWLCRVSMTPVAAPARVKRRRDAPFGGGWVSAPGWWWLATSLSLAGGGKPDFPSFAYKLSNFRSNRLDPYAFC